MVKSEFLYSKSLGMDWVYTIVLPNKFNKENNYKLFILLHGTNGNNRTLVDRVPLEELLKNNEDKIIVLPNGFNSYYLDKMEKAIIDDMIPLLNKEYKISETIIGGVSMGAFGALRLSLIYPQMFNNVLLISPAIWNPIPPNDCGVRKMCAFGLPFNDESWKKASWFSNTNNLSSNNYIVVHGNQDEIVNKENVVKFTEYCEEHNINIKKYFIDGNHDSKVVKEGIEIALDLL